MSDEEDSRMHTPLSTADDGLIHIKESQRTNLLQRVQKEVDDVSNYSKYSSHQLEVKLSLLERHFESFEKIQSQLEAIDESQLEANHRFEFEDAYFKLKSNILERLSTQRTTINEPGMTSTQYGNTSVRQSSRPQLPTLQLTKFNGSQHDWTEFYNMFCILVHDNPDLSTISKFQYLRSCLIDNAARLIQSLDITPENYEQALELLKSRYDNKGLIFQSHIEKVFNIKECSKPNVSSLRNLIDSVNVNIRALSSIASKNQISDGIILYLLTSKLDSETLAKWEEEVSTKWGNEASFQELVRPAWSDLSTFLEKRCKTLEIVNKPNTQKPLVVPHGRLINNNQVTQFKIRRASSFASTNQASSPSCLFCKTTSHQSVFHCKKFIEMNISERFRIVKRFKLCLNCLGSNHIATSCPSINRCQHCKAAHHTLLHRDEAYQSPLTGSNQASIISREGTEQPCALQASITTNQVILGTARVELQAPNGRSITVRALLDSGSQLHFVTDKIAQYLRVHRKRVNIEITGIACNTYEAYNNCSLVIKSSTNSFSTPIKAVVIPSITSYQPQSRLETSNYNIPDNITLADQHFDVPGPIDLLIGAGLFYDLLMVGQIKGENTPILQKTTLGWIVTGTTVSTKNTSHTSLINSSQPASLNQPTNEIKSSNSPFTITCLVNSIRPMYNCLNYSTEPTLETILERFWKTEEPSREPNQTAEEEECEKFFEKTTSRCPHTNKFIVKLPFKKNPKELGSSVELCTKRYFSLEKRLSSNGNTQKEYIDFIEEYVALKHMEKAASNINSNYNYIPHHCVVKPESSTTRLRVVFDGSCRTSNGLSLNDILRVGPTLQQDIFSILLRFRLHKFVLVADIAKMYRQVLVNETDTHWQSIIWRDKVSGNLSTYVLKTVTYGTSCAPYLAVKCLQVLAKEGESTHPIGSKITSRDFYVDNLMTGGSSIEEVIDIRRQVTELLKSGGFPLRKFAANTEQILQGIPISEREEIIKVDDSEYIKTLGLKWLPKEDNFSYLYNLCTTPKGKVTKRIILSHTAKLFDPLGLVNPIIVSCKLLLQRIWSLKLHWDESVPQNIIREWSDIQNQLKMITTIHIPRYVIFNSDINIHAFADASSKAYGACVYAVSYKNNEKGSSLLCSKSRVAPLKSVSLPRLELCAALLLTQLLESILKILPTPPQTITCWSDSTITLCWIAGDSTRWKPYVKNRVEKIKENVSASNWRHVPSQLNPADILTRGALASSISNNKLWFHGPEFLLKEESLWPSTQYATPDEATCEMRQVSLVAVKTSTYKADILNNLKYINNYQKLLRIFVYVSRFALSIARKEICKTGPIESEEIKQSFETICRLIQGQFFRRELQALKTNQKVDRQSKLIVLSPFLHNGLIRVGGRLNNANVPFSEKHPIVLPSTHKFVHTIIRHYHHKNLHAGVQTLNNILRNSVWILKAKQTIKQIVHNCVFCYRFRPITQHQVMGALPTDRVTPSQPFLVSGVDYCGPFYITQQLRGRSPIKSYVAIFICFSVKAVHIELVPSLTTNAFIAALKRFIARRGRCTTIFSDNATNFIGANRELKDMLQHFLTDQHNHLVYDSCQEEGIQWKFILPRSPHFGGLWESAVKQAKHYLRRAIGAHVLSFDELHTVCCQAEAIINSRPLTPLSNDPNDLQPLTPAHFLIGRSLQTILEPSTTDVNPASLKKYHVLRWIQQEFWDRWRNEYLKTLQQRTKWYTVQNNLKLHDLVLLKEESTPPLKWPLGRVIELFPGPDSQVRVVSVKTAEGIFKRAVTKIKQQTLVARFCCAGYRMKNKKCMPVCPKGCANGNCVQPNQCECLKGYKYFSEFSRNRCVPDCGKCEHGFCSAPGKCNCNTGFQLVGDTCRPVCKNCENGLCKMPDKCECHKGYEKSASTSKCEPVCHSKCHNGSCVAPDICACNEGYQMNEANICEPLCGTGCRNGTCIAPNTCECYAGYKKSTNQLICEPICEPGCTNGRCIAPGKCACERGYKVNETNECEPVCLGGCLNGKCSAPDFCTCNEGFSLVTPTACEPICKAGCPNGSCIAPETCLCDTGYEMDDFNKCQPICEGACSNGECVAPGKCECKAGFDMSAGNICTPICLDGCPNGTCIAPGVCECQSGFQKNAQSNCEPVCEPDCMNGLCIAPNICECLNGYSKSSTNSSCAPVCQSDCVNGICMAPDICVCDQGFHMSDSKTCEPICEEGCVNGKCVSPNLCTCNPGYSKSTPSICEPVCELGCPNGNCQAPNICECNEGYFLSTADNKCEPICIEDCENGFCVAPNTCECYFGYSLTENHCTPVCGSGCPNGQCIAPEECKCDYGYEMNRQNICQPVCSSKCENGKCVSPNICECNEGYEQINENICEPVCESECLNGQCISPGICECNLGFAKLNKSACEPICSKGCENGKCISPETCKCDEGYARTNENTCEPFCEYGCTNGYCKAPNYCECHTGYNNTFADICEPICEPGCVNGRCAAPGLCECHEGYLLETPNTCQPICKTGCQNGKCIGPEICKCHEGYAMVLTNICEPVCEHECINGYCTLPNTCKCNEGYRNTNGSRCEAICDTDCSNGKCIRPGICECNEGYEMSALNICVPICLQGCHNGRCIAPNKCECDSGFALIALNTSQAMTCEPICIQGCLNGYCMAPNSCECEQGFAKVTDSYCEPICEFGCSNGTCMKPGVCICNPGYTFNEKQQCQAVCKEECLNGFCIAPDKCACLEGYEMTNENICQPVCLQGCLNGKCVSPDVCECNDGYNKASDNICEPICETGCVNGVCIKPGKCECHEGYQLNSEHICEPVCLTECLNGTCTAPNTCKCKVGYWQVSSTSCQPFCETGCPNGSCIEPGICNCNEGFMMTNLRQCEPYCPDKCINADCIAPYKCQCKEGYSKISNDTCSPVCEPSCINGQCLAPNVCQCNEGFLKNSLNNCEPICQANCINGDCIAPDTCECNAGYTKVSANVCEPLCEPDCLNGICIGPDKCQCLEGFQKRSQNTCEAVCHTECLNGKCSALTGKCVCSEGFHMNKENLCEPICEPKCANGVCITPGICECLEGYNKTKDATCEAICQPSCENGDCVKPDVCQCKEGYQMVSTNKCQPMCESSCDNGFCQAPNICACNEGYQLNSDQECSPFCLPECLNGRCIAPNLCVCHQGFQLDAENRCQQINLKYEYSSTQMYDKDPENCLDGVCSCPPDYISRSFRFSDICLPKCQQPADCPDAVCLPSGLCECLEGYEFSETSYRCERKILLSGHNSTILNPILKWFFIFALISFILALKILVVMCWLTRKVSYNVDKKENEYGLIKLSQKADIIRQTNTIDV